MGRFLSIGLRLNASVKKSDVERLKWLELPLEETLARLEQEHNLSEIFDREERDGYYLYTLKRELLDRELLPFLEKFYALRYADNSHNYSKALDFLKNQPDTASRLAVLDHREFQCFQAGDSEDYFSPTQNGMDDIRINGYNILLSIDGKIIMECYVSVFNFFRRCIAAQLSEFKLSKALHVWLEL